MWDLYEKRNGQWVKVCECKSGDSAKSVAKNMNRDPQPGCVNGNHGKEFLIRTPVGNNWMKSVDTGSWRMKWVYVESGDNP